MHSRAVDPAQAIATGSVVLLSQIIQPPFRGRRILEQPETKPRPASHQHRCACHTHRTERHGPFEFSAAVCPRPVDRRLLEKTLRVSNLNFLTCAAQNNLQRSEISIDRL